jgi:AcrR family transcriptional regulator
MTSSSLRARGAVTRRGRTRRQGELFERLTEILAAEGFAHLTLDQLAERLRCSKTTLYALASSKASLVVEVVKYFFRESTEEVEARVAAATDPRARIVEYLIAVSERLRLLSREFMEDMAGFAPAADVYRQNTDAAANRIRQLIAEGIEAGVFRPVHAAFAAEMTAATMVGIQRGDMFRRLEMSDADAYTELSALLIAALGAEE